jgi:signal transduction histidine kinase
VTRPPPRPRLRTRLALLHAGLTFACGVLLLAFVDLPLSAVSHTSHIGPSTVPDTTTSNLAGVLRYSALALLVIAGLSVVLGWVIAGRALRPLGAITSVARTMSADNLTGRLRVPAAYRELVDLADTFDGLRYRLHESFTAQRQFVANASHELRTPLTVQRTLLEITLADPDATTGTLRSACEQLLDLGRQQEQLIDALLSLAGSYRPVERGESFDLADLVRTAVRERRSEARTREIRIDTSLAPAMVSGDPRLAASLVTNLVDNALRHNRPGGTVEIVTTPTGRLAVGNTGAEIPETELDRLFEPFERLGPDRTDQTDGHGLGLAIVAAVAHAHDAPLAARPRPGGGLDITVDFPGPVTGTTPDRADR